MNLTHLRRSLAAMAVSIALLVTMTNPAASATYIAEVTGGEIMLRKIGLIPPEVIDLGPGGLCTFGSFFTFDTTSTTSSSSLWPASFYSSQVRTFGSTGTYLMVMTRLSSGNVSGHVSSSTTPHTLTGMRVGFVMTIYNTTDCTPTGAPICTLAFLFNVSGTMTSLSTGNNYYFTGTSQGNVVAFPACSAGPSYLVGTTVLTTTPIDGYLS